MKKKAPKVKVKGKRLKVKHPKGPNPTPDSVGSPPKGPH